MKDAAHLTPGAQGRLELDILRITARSGGRRAKPSSFREWGGRGHSLTCACECSEKHCPLVATWRVAVAPNQ